MCCELVIGIVSTQACMHLRFSSIVHVSHSICAWVLLCVSSLAFIAVSRLDLQIIPRLTYPASARISAQPAS